MEDGELMTAAGDNGGAVGGSERQIGQTFQLHFTQQAGGKGDKETAKVSMCGLAVHVCVCGMLACKCKICLQLTR